jgi:hypothetical protein
MGIFLSRYQSGMTSPAQNSVPVSGRTRESCRASNPGQRNSNPIVAGHIHSIFDVPVIAIIRQKPPQGNSNNNQ